MSPEHPIAYLPFDSLVGDAVRFILNGLIGEGFEPVEVVDPQGFATRKEPPPEFLLAVFGERPREGSSAATTDTAPDFPDHPGVWLSSVEENFVDVAMRTSLDSGIPILILLVRHELLTLTGQVHNVSLVAKIHALKSSNVVIVAAENQEGLADALREGISRITGTPFVQEPQKEDDPGREESIAGSSLSDAAAKDDLLGFDPYVEAIERFLTNERTKGPLAMSIEGEWGSGKSSFMLQLRERLKSKGAKTVWFNAWRHDQEEALWAAFALAFVEELSQELREQSWQAQFKASFELTRRRFDWKGGWKDVAKTIVSALLLIVVAVVIWVKGAELFVVDGKTVGVEGAIYVLLGAGGTLAALRGILKAFGDASEIVGNPLRFDLKKHVKSEDYAGRISFIERFHKDFSKIIDAYAGDNKVFVFVDDLDRCEVPKAAELMGAMNLMIGDDNRLIFIIGMDRQKVAAGLAVKYEDLLPYIDGRSDEEFEKVKGRVGTEFGYSFIEKFIQLPFRVPVAGKEDLAKFLLELGKEATGEGSPTLATSEGGGVEGRRLVGPMVEDSIDVRADPEGEKQTQTQEVPVQTEAARKPEWKWNEFSLEVREDSANIRNAVMMVADAFDYNPRRIKQFLNTFRLKAYIAYNTGLLNSKRVGDNEENAITFEQLAKFVALGLRWPVLLADLDNDHDLLRRLSEHAEWYTFSKAGIEENPSTEIEGEWRKESKLLQLLAENADVRVHDTVYENNTTTELDVKRLLEISPRVVPASPSQTRQRERVEGQATSLKTRRLLAHGHVQGVGFRIFVRNLAQAFGIRGWVRNNPDGSIEITAQGTEENLRLFIEQTEIGPPSSRVDELAIEEMETDQRWEEFRMV